MATIRWCPIFPKWDIYQPLVNVRYSKKKVVPLDPPITAVTLPPLPVFPCYFSCTNARRTQQIISCSWKAPMLCRVLHDFYRHSRCCMGTLDPELRVFGLPSLSSCILLETLHFSLASHVMRSHIGTVLCDVQSAEPVPRLCSTTAQLTSQGKDFLARYVPS